MGHSGIGTALNAAEIEAQRVENQRAAAHDAAALERDREAAQAMSARIMDVWEHRIRTRAKLLLSDLSERKHPDRERQRWYDSLRASLADFVQGLS